MLLRLIGGEGEGAGTVRWKHFSNVTHSCLSMLDWNQFASKQLFSGSILATLYLFSLDGINFQMIITYESKDELKWNHYVVDNVSAVTGKLFTNWPV